MRIDVLTLFPEVIRPYVGASILGRAQTARIADIQVHQLRDYSTDPHKKVDDRPFGGGPGMVLMCQPVCDAVAAIESQDDTPALRVLLTPQGRKFDQQTAVRLSKAPRLLMICGHYEGYDERIVDLLQPEEISLGDFILTGGEVAALAVIDAVVRLLPGALGHESGATDESFGQVGLEWPHYTRPRDYRGLAVPEVLLNGNHAAIDAWRLAESQKRTAQRRPDLAGYDNVLDQPSAAHAAERSARVFLTQDELDAASCDTVAPDGGLRNVAAMSRSDRMLAGQAWASRSGCVVAG